MFSLLHVSVVVVNVGFHADISEAAACGGHAVAVYSLVRTSGRGALLFGDLIPHLPKNLTGGLYHHK